MSAADQHGKGQERLPNRKQFVDTGMSSLEGRRKLTGDVNAGTVHTPVQRGSISIQHRNLRRGDKVTCGLSNRQGSPPTKLLKGSFIETHPTTRAPVALRKQGGTTIMLLIVAETVKKSIQMQPSQGGRSVATRAEPTKGTHLVEGQ